MTVQHLFTKELMSYLIESETIIAHEKPEIVLKRLKNENHQKTYIKLVENTGTE